MKYLIKRTSTPIQVDARPDDPQWKPAETAKIESYPWKRSDYAPETIVRCLYDDTALYILFECREKYLHATHMGHQTEVWKDNCVELFLKPGTAPNIPYLNFEFNCLGYILLGHGKERIGRMPVPVEELEKIPCRATYTEPIIDESETLKTWYLEAALPFDLITRYTKTSPPLSGTHWKGNFNKCSESTKIGHWGTWTPVKTEHPDFHRPEYFGDLIFE